MKRSFASACVGAVIAAVAVTGCTAATAGPAEGDRQRAGNAQDGRDALRELTDAERIELQRAEQLLAKTCMEKAGFRYWLGPLPTVDDLAGSGYVLTDVAWAREHGYGSRLHERSRQARRDDPNIAYANSLPRTERVRYDRTLSGGPASEMLSARLPGGGTVRTPRRSCLAEAKDRLYGDFATWFQAEKTATNVTSLYVPDLVEDQRFVDAVEMWSACMRRKGHDYADPPQVRRKLPQRVKGLSRDEAFAVEAELAVAEAACATRTPLAGTARRLEDEYRAEELAPYADEITAYRRMSLEALARAEDITGGSTD